MAYNRHHAAKLLTTAEMEVFHASLGDRVGSLAPAELAATIRRARTLRDKAQDLLRRQRVATQGRSGSKGGADGLANARTGQKAQALGEVLARLEKRQAQAAAPEPKRRAPALGAAETLRQALAKKQASDPAPAARRTSSKAKAVGPSPGSTPLGPTPESARVTQHDLQFKKAGSQRVQAHVAAAVQRGQAKRDSRG